MNTEAFKHYIDDFIKNNLEDEKEKNKKFTYLMWFFSVTLVASLIVTVISIVILFSSNVSSNFTQNVMLFIGIIVFAISLLSVFYFKRRAVSTTSKNIKIVQQNLPSFINKYMELMAPQIKIQKFELKEFGGSYSELIINGNLYSCDANIKEEIRHEYNHFHNNKSWSRYKEVHYFINTLDVRLNHKPINIVGNVGIKLGKTKGNDIDKYVSESMEFNKTYNVEATKEDGFNLLTPVRVETLLKEQNLMRNINLSVTKELTSFYRNWEVKKTYNRNMTLASRPLTIMSADDKKMSIEIIKHIKEVVENPMNNWKIVNLLKLQK